MLVKILYLSLDPAMRGWMNDARSYIAPVDIGETMRAGGAGEVLVSNHPDFAPETTSPECSACRSTQSRTATP